MERRSAEAIADATQRLREPVRPGILGAAAAELIADEHASRRPWEEAVRWYRRKPRFRRVPARRSAGWEGGRILEEQLGRGDEARELYAAACRAGNRKACVKSGEPAPRPRLFPRRRGP